MDQAISQFLQPGTLALAVAVFILTFLIRRVVETAVPTLKKQSDENHPKVTYATGFARWYQQVILYAIPVAVGTCLGALQIQYVTPSEVSTVGGGMVFGAVVGWFSSFLYKIVRRALVQKAGVDVDIKDPIDPTEAE